MNAGEERREGVVTQCTSNRLELCDGDGKSIPVGEFVEASDDPLLKIKSGSGLE